MKTKIQLDLHATTHRKASDCTCFECMAEETERFVNELRQKQNVSIQKERGDTTENNSDTGRLLG